MKEIPENVEIHKPKQPKGWSYPLKASEISEALDLETLGEKFKIFYDNSPFRPYKRQKKEPPPKDFPVFSITHFGPKAKSCGSPEELYYYMTVRLCRPVYRPTLQKIIKTEIFPLVSKWLRDTQTIPTWNNLSLGYNAHKGPQMALVLSENRYRERYIKLIDLDVLPATLSKGGRL